MLSTVAAPSPAKPGLPGPFPLARPGSEAEAPFTVRFAQGLPGFPAVTDYRLLPAGASRDLLMLAAVGPAQLRFLVLPYVPGWLPVDHGDLVAAAGTVGIAEEHLATVMMLNLQKAPGTGETEVSVNLRAPIFIDVRTGMALQHVLPNPDYGIRHPLRLTGHARGGDGSGA